MSKAFQPKNAHAEERRRTAFSFLPVIAKTLRDNNRTFKQRSPYATRSSFGGCLPIEQQQVLNNLITLRYRLIAVGLIRKPGRLSNPTLCLQEVP